MSSLRQRDQDGGFRLRVVSARSPLWNAAVEVVDVEGGNRDLLDDP